MTEIRVDINGRSGEMREMGKRKDKMSLPGPKDMHSCRKHICAEATYTQVFVQYTPDQRHIAIRMKYQQSGEFLRYPWQF